MSYEQYLASLKQINSSKCLSQWNNEKKAKSDGPQQQESKKVVKDLVLIESQLEFI
jgi:hypothetical protein